MQNKDGLIFVAQSKLIAFYWKTWTFHGFGMFWADVPFRIFSRFCANDD